MNDLESSIHKLSCAPGFIFLLFCGFLLPGVAVPASFDCSKATTNNEIAICSDPKLSILDASLGEAYQALMADASSSATEETSIRKVQLEWLNNRNAVCNGDTTCLRAYIHERTDALLKMRQSQSATYDAGIPSSHANTQGSSKLAISELFPHGSSKLLAESTEELEPLDLRLRLFVTSEECGPYLPTCLTGTSETRNFTINLIQRVYGADVDARGYTAQDVGSRQYGQASGCLSDSVSALDGINKMVHFYISDARFRSGAAQYPPKEAKASFEQWARNYSSSCKQFFTGTGRSRPERAYIAVSKLLTHVDEVVRVASVELEGRITTKKLEAAKLKAAEQQAAELRAQRLETERTEKARLENEQQLANEESQRKAVIERESRARALGYIDGWKQTGECLELKSLYDLLEQHWEAGDVYAKQRRKRPSNPV